MQSDKSNVNFLFDLVATQPVDGAEFHGGGKYAKILFFALIDIVRTEQYSHWNVFALYDSSKKLEKEILEFAQASSIQLVDLHKSNLPTIIATHSISRLYTALPFILGPFGLFDSVEGQRCQIYCTIHGLRPLEIPTPLSSLIYLSKPADKLRSFAKILIGKRLFKRDFTRFKALIEKSKILAVSNHTKYSIMSFFDKSENDIKVFYSPDVTYAGVFEEGISNSRLAKNYFLLVSGNRWLKNNLISVLALDQLFSARKDISQNVIITGVSNPGVYLNKIKNKERFNFLPYVSENELANYYKHAYALIYMSLNEGFGYPPLEAMKFEVPVLTSPYTSIPEICGDAVLYANPHSVDEVKSRILQLLNSEVHRQISLKGNKRFEHINARQKKDLSSSIMYLLD